MPLRVEEVLDAPRDAVERAAVLSGRDLGVGAPAPARARVSVVSVMTQRSFAVEAGEPVEVDARQPLGGQRPRLDPARQRGDRRERDVLVLLRQRAGVAPRSRTKRSREGPGATPGIIGFQSVAGASVRLERDLARPRAPLHRRSHRAPPVARDLRLLASAVNSTRTSFSASATVAGEISGPTGAAVPNAGGVPSTGVGVGSGAAVARLAAAAPTTPAAVRARNFRRDCDMAVSPLGGNPMRSRAHNGAYPIHRRLR